MHYDVFFQTMWGHKQRQTTATAPFASLEPVHSYCAKWNKKERENEIAMNEEWRTKHEKKQKKSKGYTLL